MKHLRFVFSAFAVLWLCGVAVGQDRAGQLRNNPLPARPSSSPYNALREESARQAIHRNAAWKAAQRRERLQWYKWMGYSPARPAASPLQFMGADPTVGLAVPYYHFPGVILSGPR